MYNSLRYPPTTAPQPALKPDTSGLQKRAYSHDREHRSELIVNSRIEATLAPLGCLFDSASGAWFLTIRRGTLTIIRAICNDRYRCARPRCLRNSHLTVADSMLSRLVHDALPFGDAGVEA